jgi:hypothetical protein
MTKQALSALLALFILLRPIAYAQQLPSPPAAAPAPSAAAVTPPTSPASHRPAATAPQPSAEAQIAPHRWDVDRVRCADLLRASDDDRASAAMFYYGYLAAKASIHIIDTSRIGGNIAKVMQLCEAKPDLTVPQAFRQALHSPAQG